MNQTISEIGKIQSSFVKEGSFNINERKIILKRLKSVIKNNESAILKALNNDLGKSEFEAFSSEVGFLYQEINLALKNLAYWASEKKIISSISLFPSSSKIQYVPFGKALIIAPWNYPFQLTIAPMIAAISAGNPVLLKPSEITPDTAELIEQLIHENFEAKIARVVLGEGKTLIPKIFEEYNPNIVFFTGSTQVGKIIATQAAEKLIPSILELGGKSPCIIDKTASLDVAVKRIVFGKCLNAGQTCVAPDYFIVHEDIQKDFILKYKEVVTEFYGDNGGLDNPNYTRIINENHFNRLVNLLEGTEILIGGNYAKEKLKIEPTLVKAQLDSPIMQEEIFGPISPVFTFNKEEDIVNIVAKNANPLSLYLFANNKKLEENILQKISFGGGSINNTLMHIVEPELPFGGIGNSGNGAYHGKYGFQAFSHKRSVVKTGTWFDLKQKYPPHSKGALKLVKWLLK